MLFKVKGFLCSSLKKESKVLTWTALIIYNAYSLILYHNRSQNSDPETNDLPSTILFNLVIIILLIGVYKSEHWLMVPWMIVQVLLILGVIYNLFLQPSLFMFYGWLLTFMIYSLLVVLSFFVKVKDDAKNDGAVANLISEPNEIIINTPQNDMFLDPQNNKTPQPLDDLPPSYNNVTGTSAPPPLS